MRGTCLVNGKHTPLYLDRECPLNPNREAARQAERERKRTRTSSSAMESVPACS